MALLSPSHRLRVSISSSTSNGALTANPNLTSNCIVFVSNGSSSSQQPYSLRTLKRRLSASNSTSKRPLEFTSVKECFLDEELHATVRLCIRTFYISTSSVEPRISAGALLLFNRCLLLEVQDIRRYGSFSEMLEVELANALPGIQSVEEGVQIYRKFYTEEKEKSNGVLAIHVLKPASQPYISLGILLSGLGSEGVGALIGMMHTAGTVSDALPPPKSQLLSSFMKLYRPNFEGSTLTDAARSLAKHTHRSNEGWWGSFRGGDSEKNRLALEIVDRLLNECRWMNVYDIPAHGRVFEIRVHEGYGARWSHDGSKFIGFLEPYTEEGHSKGWKH